jgi:hypothetical protein
VWSIQKGHAAAPDTEYGFLRYASSTLINHLKTCGRQTPAIRARAKHDSEAASPRKPGRLGSTHLSIQPPWPQFHHGTFQHSPQYHDQMLPPSLPSTRACSPAASISALSAFPSPYLGVTTPFDDGPLYSPAQSSANLPNPGSRSQSVLINDSGIWPPEYQTKFEERIARLTVSAGLPLSWVDNPEWIDFIKDFLPFAWSPLRKVLTNRLIPTAAKNHQNVAKAAAKGQNTTLQADGWMGVNFHHLLAFMITFNKQVRSKSQTIYMSYLTISLFVRLIQ